MMTPEPLLNITASLLTRPEIHTASDWWAKQLFQGAEHRSGDVMIDMVAAFGKSKLDRPDERKINEFRLTLITLAAIRCAESWREDEPIWGSSFRTLSVDYGPDRILRCALDFAGISGGDLLLPIKTMMWINPGNVTVRPGYHGKEVTIYPIKEQTQ